MLTAEAPHTTEPAAAELDRSLRSDLVFLTLILVLSTVPYLTGLGFYSDDWAFLGLYHFTPEQSLAGYFDALYKPPNYMRPVQFALLAVLYELFGSAPLGYHVFNLAIFAGGVLLFHLVLRELAVPRLFALSIPLVYGMLPHFSTDRFWIAAFQVTLSMTLFFVTVYSELRAVRARRVHRWAWHLLGVLSLIASVLAYEVMIPLFALTPLLVWFQNGRSSTNNIGAPWLSPAALLLALVPALVFKVKTSARMGALPLREHVRWFDQLIADAAATSFGDYGLRLPILLGNVWHAGATGASFAIGIATALISFAYLMRAIRSVTRPIPSLGACTATAVGGAVLFVLGLAIFATNTNAQISGAGISNRVMIASALGVSVCFVAFAAALALACRHRFQRRVLCALIAFIAGAQCTLLNGIAWHWVRAYGEAQQVLSAFHRQLPEVQLGAAIIGDGFCPYVGPAIVFESSWDLTGALRVRYNTMDLRANVVTPNLRVEQDELVASLYSGGMMDRYPYDHLIIHNVARGVTVPIPDAAAAHAYFARYNPDRTGGCPPGRAGIGVSIF